MLYVLYVIIAIFLLFWTHLFFNRGF